MWRSVTSFSLAALLLCVPAWGASLPSVEDALKLAFPGSSLERETVFLTEDQLTLVESLSSAPGQRAMLTRFKAVSKEKTVGWAYLDTHRVRTLPETVLVVLDQAGEIRRVEVVAFREPHEYLPPPAWYDQFHGPLSEELSLKRGIRPITGATLTARATTDAVRRVLAVHTILTSGKSQ